MGTTICKCGHAMSQHHGDNRLCDYRTYSCECTGYKRQKPAPFHHRPLTHEQVLWLMKNAGIVSDNATVEVFNMIRGDYMRFVEMVIAKANEQKT